MRIDRRRAVLGVLLLALVLLASACSGADDGAPSPPATSGTTPDESTTTPTPPSPSPSGPTSPPTTGQTPDAGAGTLDGMSLRQRVGQLFMTGTPADQVDAATVSAITDLHVGNVMLTGRSQKGVAATADVTKALRAEVDQSSTAGVRLLVATDQEGGAVQVLRGPGFSTIPDALTQGTSSVSTLRRESRGWARELRRAGVDMNLAPVMDTVPGASFAPSNAPIGAYDREYGYTTGRVSSHGIAFLTGMQDAGVAATVKHFPGLGRVTANTDVASGVTDDRTTRDDPYLRPFRNAIEAGTKVVMMSTAVYTRIDPKHPAAFSRRTVEGLLRGDLGFDGVVISDDLSNATQVASWSPGQRAVKFVSAGGDLVLAVDPGQMPAMVEAVLDKAREDPAFARRVDEAARRVVRMKRAG